MSEGFDSMRGIQRPERPRLTREMSELIHARYSGATPCPPIFTPDSITSDEGGMRSEEEVQAIKAFWELGSHEERQLVAEYVYRIDKAEIFVPLHSEEIGPLESERIALIHGFSNLSIEEMLALLDELNTVLSAKKEFREKIRQLDPRGLASFAIASNDLALTDSREELLGRITGVIG